EVDDLGAASARSAQSARETRDSYGATAEQQPFGDADEAAPTAERLEPQFDLEDGEVLHEEAPQPRGREQDYDLEDEPPPPFTRPQPRGRDAEEHYEPRPPRAYRGIAKLVVVLLVLGGIGATVSWQWSHITGRYRFVSHLREH